jgi:hypothetical protein
MNKIIIFSSFLILASCANLVPLTTQMIDKNKWSEEDLKKIQYYNSGDITLQRVSSQSGSNIDGGVITEENNKAITEVTIKENTKAVAVNTEGRKLSLSFEKDDNHYLTFGANPDRNNYFVLLASEWRDGIGKVTYNNEKYFTSPESKSVIILVNMKKIRKLNIQQRVAGGREVR